MCAFRLKHSCSGERKNKKQMNPSHDDSFSEEGKLQKIQSLRDMISNAEKTIQGAKAVLLQLEGKKRPGRKRKIEEESDGSTVVQGTFDGQIMLGSDGKQYPVPANYASKSKLVEGDFLKLTITEEGSFIYKQIGPVERRHAIGMVTQDEYGNYYIMANGKPYRVLLASITYFKAEPGDEAVIVTPRDIESSWGSIENIIQKAKFSPSSSVITRIDPSTSVSEVPKKKIVRSKKVEQNSSTDIQEVALGTSTEPEKTQETADTQSVSDTKTEQSDPTYIPAQNSPVSAKHPVQEESSTNDEATEDLLNEWRTDIEEIEREIERSKNSEKTQ